MTFGQAADAFNTPAVSGYVVEISKDGEVVATVESDSPVVTIDGLTPETRYTVSAYVTNIIGRSDIVTSEVTTSAKAEEPTEESTEAPTEEPTENPTEEETQAPSEKPTTAPGKGDGDVPDTGDTAIILWATLLPITALALAALLTLGKKRSLF